LVEFLWDVLLGKKVDLFIIDHHFVSLQIDDSLCSDGQMARLLSERAFDQETEGKMQTECCLSVSSPMRNSRLSDSTMVKEQGINLVPIKTSTMCTLPSETAFPTPTICEENLRSTSLKILFWSSSSSFVRE